MSKAVKTRDFIKKVACLHKACREDIIEEYGGLQRYDVFCEDCGQRIRKEILCDNCRGTGKIEYQDRIDGFVERDCGRCDGTGRLDYDKEMTPDMPPLKY